MAEFVKVARKSELPEDSGYLVEAGGQEIALYKVEDEVYAIDQICPHAGGPLAEGGLNGDKAICPWHGWEFNVKTGECDFNPAIKQETFEVRVEGDDIYIKV